MLPQGVTQLIGKTSETTIMEATYMNQYGETIANERKITIQR